jgi:hypothetical protein
MNRPGSLAAGLLLAACCGCSSIALPSWSHPGSEQVQRRRALQYDPYPEHEIGPPVAGLRPREYDKPPPEPSRARWRDGNWDKQ